jgi:hypothetical protein
MYTGKEKRKMERKNQNADKFGGGRPSNHTFQGGQGAGKST